MWQTRLFCQVQGVQGEDGPDVRDATVRPGVHRAEHEGIRGTGKIWVKTMRWRRSNDIASTDGFFAQVLQMSVPIDDNDSYNDLQLDFSRKNHTFSMDNVGYITKENVDSIGNSNKLLTSYNNIILHTSEQQLLRDQNFQTWRYEDNI